MKKLTLLSLTILTVLSLSACGSTSHHKSSSSSHSSSKVVKKHHEKKQNKKQKQASTSSSAVNGQQQNQQSQQTQQPNRRNRLETDREQAARTGALTQSQMNDPSNFDGNGNFTEKGWEAMEGIDWNQEYNDRSWDQHPVNSSNGSSNSSGSTVQNNVSDYQ